MNEIKNGRYEENGKLEWYLNDQLHRDDGPAIESLSGDKHWFIEGKRHRVDGPAIQWCDGTTEWFYNDKRHREYGPAVEYLSGIKQWFQHGKRLTGQEFGLWTHTDKFSDVIHFNREQQEDEVNKGISNGKRI